MLNWLAVERNIAPHIPVIDKSVRRDGTFAREDFHYDQANDTYTCAAGKTLATSGTLVNDGATLLYRGSTLECGSCQFKARCCPNTPARKIPRSLHEAARDLARSLAGTPAFEQSRHRRHRLKAATPTGTAAIKRSMPLSDAKVGPRAAALADFRNKICP
jgi:hypothetical protein